MHVLQCMVAALGWIVLAEATDNSQWTKCWSNEYKCDGYNGPCIPSYKVCNGHADCPYGDDEYYCSSSIATDLTTNKCPDDYYECMYGDRCIPMYWLCDGYDDCPYGDDEYSDQCTTTLYYTRTTTADTTSIPNLSTSKCPDNYYECKYTGVCIPESWLCDGYQNCLYGDDEYDCYTDDYTSATTTTTTTTTPDMSTALPPFRCEGAFDYIYDRCILVDPFTFTTWDEARYLCQKFSSDLVVVDDFNFYSKLLQYINSRGLDSYHYWVGARDQQEGVWRWVDSTPVHVGAPLWALYGCTNNYHVEPRPSEAERQDCAYLDWGRGMYMSDASCEEKFAAICQGRRIFEETEETKVKDAGDEEDIAKEENESKEKAAVTMKENNERKDKVETRNSHEHEDGMEVVEKEE